MICPQPAHKNLSPTCTVCRFKIGGGGLEEPKMFLLGIA